MNVLAKELKKLVEEKEKKGVSGGRFRQKYHLMPPVGWLNDPNGMCQFQGVYHAFFQYSPLDVDGGVKMWGHYAGRDMVNWEYKGVSLYPDQPFDCHGVYSGCAFVEDGHLYLYYTGNVKQEDREHDYVLSGREANTVLVVSEDGYHLGRKQLLMRNEDYPADVTCHVRDPKVWKQNGVYCMLQGARTKDDRGQALLFTSENRTDWTLVNRIETAESFGYMWECPDYFEIEGEGRTVKIFSASVQGLEGEMWKDKNVYQSGYFEMDGDICGKYSLSDYHLWDYGFDYYAPQSFTTEDGRVILTGWMGMPDCDDYGNEPTVAEGWQHCFTLPREVYVEDGKVKQRPAAEFAACKKETVTAKDKLEIEGVPAFEADIRNICENEFQAVLGGGLHLAYRDGRFEMRFDDQSRAGISGGRHLRYCEVEKLSDVKILGDVSSVEVFINGGEIVFSTRYYPESYSLRAETKSGEITFSKM